MGSYHQMGHDSWNLVTDSKLKGFKGIILSPVNEPIAELDTKLKKLTAKNNTLNIILDPQYYKPSSQRGCLPEWPHFELDVDTVDATNTRWWHDKVKKLLDVAKKLNVSSVCTLSILPRQFSDDFYKWSRDLAAYQYEEAKESSIETLFTLIVSLPEMATKGRSETIASIVSSTKIDRVYLVISDDIPPRQQRKDVESLVGVLKLIKLLEDADIKVLVSFTGLDMLLWKAAGASDVATGKFFNLRRFDHVRFFDEGPEGGRVIPYWTDSNLITWLRDSDVLLLNRHNLISPEIQGFSGNPYSVEILNILKSGSGKAWVALGWRQYLHWFASTEELATENNQVVKSILANADAYWRKVDELSLFMTDRQNDGSWIRPWLNAIATSKL